MKLLTRFFFFAILFLSVAARCFSAEQQFNVLFIMSDDLNCSLSCYGHPLVKSPNIDKLAKRGVRFEHAYCQYPLCNPSRASLMTGRRPNTTGVVGNGLHFRKVLPDVVTLPELFKKNGYYSARIGKIYHYGVPGQIGTSGLDDPQSWTEFINPRGHDKDVEDKVINYMPNNGNLGAALAWLDDEAADEEETDGKVASEAIRLLEEHKDKPFFIAAGFYRPHVPEITPKKYYELYPFEKVQLPVEPREHMKAIPDMAFHVKPPNYNLEPEQLRRFKRGYFASVSFMDAQVGRLLKALEKLKLADKTIVVFISDHGWMLGEHGQWQKQALFEQAARVPMIIYVPKGKGNGKTSPRVVELVDIYPTIAELCGLSAPAGFQGKSLKPLLENPKAAWDKPAFTQVTSADRHGRSIRTERWRYTEWAEGKAGAELYDQEKDPQELKNLALDGNYARLIADLRMLLKAQGPEATAEGAKGKKAR
jgi:iduronate 2-sulfatase